MRLICEPEPVCEDAAKRLIEEWRRVDIKVELVTLSTAVQASGPRRPVGRRGDRLPAASGQDAVASQAADVNKSNAAPADGESWDIVYRTGRMTEPMMELWPLLSLDTVARLQSIRYLPDWLRQGLIDLDRTADWATTVATVQELHRELADTAQLIPLWEIDDALVFRKTVRGIPDPPLHAYHDLELWISDAWYPTDSQ